MTKPNFLELRNRYTPAEAKIIFVFESPPASGAYFYNPSGPVTEPLFRAMMKDVLEIAPMRKADGLKEFAASGYFLVDATYTPVNYLSAKNKKAVILRDLPALIADLGEYAKADTRVVLAKANVCRLLEQKLIEAGFNVANHGTVVPFPSSSHQGKFRTAIRQVLGT